MEEQDLPTIPLEKLNCFHCTRFDGRSCTKEAKAVKIGEVVDWHRHYCLHIFKNFREEAWKE